MHLKMFCKMLWSLCLGLNVLNIEHIDDEDTWNIHNNELGGLLLNN